MNFQTKKREQDRKNDGFVLILTMLIVSVIVSISLSVVIITIKEIRLSGYMRDSERAFIAADRALECALFWDRAVPPQAGALQFTPFATSSAWVAPPNINSAVCYTGVAGDGSSVRLNNPAETGWTVLYVTPTTGQTAFYIDYANGTSADVVVWKSGLLTEITSNGYNKIDPNDLRRTQRTIVSKYNF